MLFWASYFVTKNNLKLDTLKLFGQILLFPISPDIQSNFRTILFFNLHSISQKTKIFFSKMFNISKYEIHNYFQLLQLLLEPCPFSTLSLSSCLSLIIHNGIYPKFVMRFFGKHNFPQLHRSSCSGSFLHIARSASNLKKNAF